MKVVGQKNDGICAYLSQKNELNSGLASHKTYNDAQIIHDFEYATRNSVFLAFEKLRRAMENMPKEDAWNSCSVELCKAARVKMKFF